MLQIVWFFFSPKCKCLSPFNEWNGASQESAFCQERIFCLLYGNLSKYSQATSFWKKNTDNHTLHMRSKNFNKVSQLMYWNSLFTRDMIQLRLTELDQFSSNYWYVLLRSILGAGTRNEHRTCLSSVFKSDLDPVAGTMDDTKKWPNTKTCP